MSRLTTKDFTHEQAKALSEQVFVALNNVSKPNELTKITLLHNGSPHLLSIYEVLALQTALNVKFWRSDSVQHSKTKSQVLGSKKRKRVQVESEEESAKKKAKNYHYYPVTTEEKTSLKFLGKEGESLFSTGMFEPLYETSVESITLGSADITPLSAKYVGKYGKTKPIARLASRLTGAKDSNGMFTALYTCLIFADLFCL